MPTDNPNSPNSPAGGHQRDDSVRDDLVLDDLVRQTLDLESFERDVQREMQSAPLPLRLQSPVIVTSVSSGSPRRNLALWLGSGLAAAAALTMAVVVLAPKPQPAPVPIARNENPMRERARDTASDIASNNSSSNSPRNSSSDAVIRTVSQPVRDDDMQQFAYLDPDIATGLPNLASERSVVLAVYQGNAPRDCECLAWSVEKPGDWDSAKGSVLEQALAQPFMRDASSLTLVKITGPRLLLPFHDDDARALARCVPSSNCDEACAFHAASQCVSDDLSVQTRTIDWAVR